MSSRPARVLFGLLALTGLAGAVPTVARAAPAGPASLYYDRTLMGEAGRRCGLFVPPVLVSLEAGAAQARAAALAAGASPPGLAAVAGRAVGRARAVSCTDPQLRIAAQRVRAAFMSWSHQPSLDLPDRAGGWRAQRALGRERTPRWALVRRGVFAGRPVLFGLVRRDGAPLTLSAVLAWPEAAHAYAARLVVRDPARAPDPYLAGEGGPPPRAERAALAAGRGAADPALMPGATAFTFPAQAADALAALDPREAVRLELVFAGRGQDRVVSMLLPAGDFATGRAFLLAGR